VPTAERCLNSPHQHPCLSLHRRWDTGKELTDDDIRAVLPRVGFEMKADRPCKRRLNAIGDAPICTSTGSDSEFDYFFAVFSHGPSGPRVVVSEVTPHYVLD
jgi:hypothetical protein